MSEDHPEDDRRQHRRYNMRVRGIAHVLCQSDVLPVEVWTKNISDGGVSLLSLEELQGERMMLELPLPKYDGMLLECEVRHRSSYERLLVNGDIETTYVCGLQFLRVLAKVELHETMLSAFDQAAEEEDNLLLPLAEESLMPLLSAIGILVVWMSRLPWA